jgi:hypothetical protein
LAPKCVLARPFCNSADTTPSWDLLDDLWRKAVAAIADSLHPFGYRTAGKAASSNRRDNAPAIAAIERKGSAKFFGIAACDLEAVRALAQVRSLDRDLAVMPAFLISAGMTLEKEAVSSHHPINPLAVCGSASLGNGLSAQDAPDARSRRMAC